MADIYDSITQSGVNQFVGRGQELAALHQLLQEHDQVAIAGIAGAGKTQLAIQYAKAYLNYYPGGICWLLARSDLGLQIVEFALSHFSNFTIPPRLTPTTQVIYCWQHWIPFEGEVLVIIDDVTDYLQIQPYLPSPSSRFKVLLTTRVQLEPLVQMLSLDVLTPPAALDLLTSRIGKYRVKDTRGKPFGTGSKGKQGKPKRTASPPLIKVGQGGVAQQLCEWLGYLPLGVELVGRYLEQERNLPLERMQVRLQKQLLTHWGKPEGNAPENLMLQPRLATAFELSWNRLDEQAQQLGCLLSVFALAPIPWAQVESVFGQLYLPGALLGKLLNVLPADADADIEMLIKALLNPLKDAREQLVQLYLLQHTKEGTYQLHPLIWDLWREKLAGLEQFFTLKQAFCQVMVAVAKQIPASPSRNLIEEVTPAIPHVVEAVTALREFISDEDLIASLEGLGGFYQSQGFYDLAVPWREQCLWLTQACLGADHPDVAAKLHNLAGIYYAQERYTEAEALSVQALKICEQQLGLEHPLTLATRKNLDALYIALQKE
jgi:tetratricopeptide (TPR) repeat protein